MVLIDDLSTQLDRLFDRWAMTYPEPVRAGFHRDGIIYEPTYLSEDHRILFVLLEPNSRGGAYDKYYGCDLRQVFGEESLSKSLNVNLARWTRVLLDGHTTFGGFDGLSAQTQVRRVAIMNLKKFAGSGTADYVGTAIHAWHDRRFIHDQVTVMRPSVVVACGKEVHRLFRWIMSDDRFSRFPDEVGWNGPGFVVVPANHPSLRPANAGKAFERLVNMARTSRLAAFR